MTGRVDTMFKNGSLVTHEGIIRVGIAIDAGKIVAIGDERLMPEAKEVIDARGKYILPGLIDPHQHPGGQRGFLEDIRSESRLAALGGVTSVLGTVKSPRISRTHKQFVQPEDVVSYKKVFAEAKEIVETEATVDIGFNFAIMSDEQASEIPEYAEEFGVTSYKFYVGYRIKAEYLLPRFNEFAGFPVTGWDDGTMLIAFENIAKIGGLALIHAENTQLVRVLHQRVVASGRKDLVAWYQRSPGWVEASHVVTYAHLAKVTGCTLYVVHTCSKEGLDEIRHAKSRGVKIISEVCPHYLIIDPEDPFPGVFAKINTPIQDTPSRNALWEGIKDGVVECVGTDQLPGLKKERFVEGDAWKSTAVGISSVHHLLPLMITEGYYKRGIPLETLVKICSFNNAKYFGLYPRKGAIQVGSDADLVVVDLEKTRVLRAEEWPTACDWSIYEGRELRGWPILTMLRGRIIMKDGEIIGKPSGQYLYRQTMANK